MRAHRRRSRPFLLPVRKLSASQRPSCLGYARCASLSTRVVCRIEVCGRAGSRSVRVEPGSSKRRQNSSSTKLPPRRLSGSCSLSCAPNLLLLAPSRLPSTLFILANMSATTNKKLRECFIVGRFLFQHQPATPNRLPTSLAHRTHSTRMHVSRR